MTTDAVGREYMKETTMMFVSGIIVAIAVEHCNLHKRIALNAMFCIGTSARRFARLDALKYRWKCSSNFPPLSQTHAGTHAADNVSVHVDIEHGDDGHDGSDRRRRAHRAGERS